MPERTWTPKLICRDWRNPMLMVCPWHHYDQADHEHRCCQGGWTKLATNRYGSPLRKPGCPIGPMRLEDKSYRPRRAHVRPGISKGTPTEGPA